MFIYIFFRIAAFLIAINIIFPNGTPNIFKIIFSIFLSIIIGMNVDSSIEVDNLFQLVRLGILETINGLVLGYIVNICFYSLRLVGKLIDNQLGLSMASIYDPNIHSQSTIMENMMYFIGIVVFFGLNIHYILISSIQNSFKIIPVGQFILKDNLGYILKIFLSYFILGIKMAIPIILVLIITDLITGIISRSISGLNVMIIGMPLKMLVGLVFFLNMLPFLINGMHEMFKGLINVLNGTFALNIINMIFY
ncbi:flagellar biosynthetic protein FliR [Clostridium sardiniense]